MDRGNKALADAIKKCRESYGINQDDAAEALSMSKRNYQYLESGSVKITVDKEAKVMKALRKLYIARTGLVLDEDKENESIANFLRDLVMDLLRR